MRLEDGIIESLLKQLHNPYLATPLSIAAYRMATPDADHHRQNVVYVLERLYCAYDEVLTHEVGRGLTGFNRLCETRHAGKVAWTCRRFRLTAA